MRTIHKACAQVTINSTLTLPEHKPNIELLLRVTSTPFIDKAAVADRKVIFSGHVLMGIEYVAYLPDCSQPVYFVFFESPFNGFIDRSQVRAYMSIQLKALVEFQDFQAIDSRTIHQLMIIKIDMLKLSKSGESLPHLCGLPYLTVCRQDKATSAKNCALPCIISSDLQAPTSCNSSCFHFESMPDGTSHLENKNNFCEISKGAVDNNDFYSKVTPQPS